MAVPIPLQEQPDFSLVLGGPLYQMLRRARLTGPALELVRRRVVTSVLLCWVPLAVLSLAQAHFMGGAQLSFFRDIETHVRFLVSLPVLILAEMIVHQRIRPVVKAFVERRVVTAEELPKFYAAIDSAMRIRNSVIVEVALLIFVFTVGTWIWRHQVALQVASGYASPQGGQMHLTMAGYWFAFVSVKCRGSLHGSRKSTRLNNVKTRLSWIAKGTLLHGVAKGDKVPVIAGQANQAVVWIFNIEDCADGERHDSGKGHHVRPVVVPRFDDEASNECAQAAQEKKKKKHSVGGMHVERVATGIGDIEHIVERRKKNQRRRVGIRLRHRRRGEGLLPDLFLQAPRLCTR